MTPSDFGL